MRIIAKRRRFHNPSQLHSRCLVTKYRLSPPPPLSHPPQHMALSKSEPNQFRFSSFSSFQLLRPLCLVLFQSKKELDQMNVSTKSYFIILGPPRLPPPPLLCVRNLLFYIHYSRSEGACFRRCSLSLSLSLCKCSWHIHVGLFFLFRESPDSVHFAARNCTCAIYRIPAVATKDRPKKIPFIALAER